MAKARGNPASTAEVAETRRSDLDVVDQTGRIQVRSAEDDKGVTINGMKMLGTSAVFAHHTWVGNLQPLGPGREGEAITCPVPLNAPGVSIWPRKPFERHAQGPF